MKIQFCNITAILLHHRPISRYNPVPDNITITLLVFAPIKENTALHFVRNIVPLAKRTVINMLVYKIFFV